MTDSKFTGMRLPPVLRGRLNRYADYCELTMTDFCRRLLDAGISRLEADSSGHEDDDQMRRRADEIAKSLAAMARSGMISRTQDAEL